MWEAVRELLDEWEAAGQPARWQLLDKIADASKGLSVLASGDPDTAEVSELAKVVGYAASSWAYELVFDPTMRGGHGDA